ncbi:MAG: hypothetical protein ABDI07_11040 [Candidatus Kryptonium sp.]
MTDVNTNKNEDEIFWNIELWITYPTHHNIKFYGAYVASDSETENNDRKFREIENKIKLDKSKLGKLYANNLYWFLC